MLNANLQSDDLNRIYRALDKVQVEAGYKANNVSWKLATEYRNLVIKNLVSQKYAGVYASYNWKYAKWKKKKVTGGIKYWILTGSLLKAITTFKAPYQGNIEWWAGVPYYATDENGKSIAMYGFIMEHGKPSGPGGAHPARPLFNLTFVEFVDSSVIKKIITEAWTSIRKAWT